MEMLEDKVEELKINLHSTYSPHTNPLPKGEGIDQIVVASSLPLGEIE
ncbi:MAG: hypothetical protein Q8S84_06210 [bacterium]|nr:hypothetical protein [bacterium]MDP3381068.1 hypothetical protein [bacterium]